MQQLDWQQRFEAWLAGHLTEGDSAHDISHFRRVWEPHSGWLKRVKSIVWSF